MSEPARPPSLAGSVGHAVETPVPEDVPLEAWHDRVAAAVAAGHDVLDLYVCTDHVCTEHVCTEHVCTESGPGGAGSSAGEGSGDEPALEVVIRLTSSAPEQVPPVWLRTAVPANAGLASIADLVPAAAWEEREAHEMLGLQLVGAVDLRPLLLPPDFPGHPLRKDFPLPARVQTPWPGSYEPAGGRPRRPVLPIGVPEAWTDGMPR